jgi:hemerythrin-like domain-containing protein
MTQISDAIDAVDLLQRDHDEIRRLLDALGAVQLGAVQLGAVQLGAGRPRGTAVDRLVTCQSKHEAIEEQYFWPLVRRRVQDGARLATQAVGQELELKHELNLLSGLSPADPEFELALRQLITASRQHLDYEEKHVWPGVRLALSEPERAELGAQLARGRRLAPTRPHPRVPPAPEVQRLAGRIAGSTDRIRDALGGRPGS